MASAIDVANEVVRQGGSVQQAWVAAALVSGIESNGQPTDKNPTSTACGLFQFLTTTWISNGGGKYAPNACAATWQQQVSVFLTASQGNNFYPWAPDLGGAYNGTPIYAPKAGSKVANKISSLASSTPAGNGVLSGQVPTAWVQATDTGGATATSGLGSLIPGGGSVSSGNQCTPVLSGLSVTLLNSCQADELLGGLLMAVGGLFVILGLGVVLADVGLRKSAPAIVGGIIGRSTAKRSIASPAPTQEDDEDTAAIRNARRTYDRQQRTDYNRQVNSGLRKRGSIGKSQPARDF